MRIDFTNSANRKILQDEFDKRINIYGEEGWEMVNILDTKLNGTTIQIICVFKREKA